MQRLTVTATASSAICIDYMRSPVWDELYVMIEHYDVINAFVLLQRFGAHQSLRGGFTALVGFLHI